MVKVQLLLGALQVYRVLLLIPLVIIILFLQNDTFVLGSNVTKTADNSVFFGKEAAYVADSATTKG